MEFFLIRHKPGGKFLKPVFANTGAKADGQQIIFRNRAHGRDIGQIDPQEFSGDQVRRIIRQKMHALDQGIDGNNVMVSRRRFDQGGVVRQPQRTRRARRQGREIACNEFELTGWRTICHR